MSSGPTSGDAGGTSFHVTPGEASQVALSEEEQALIAKLLGDPTYFPIEFRRWLKDFMDNADLQINPGQITGGGAGGGSANATYLPAGVILPYATTTIGKDCLVCDGAEYLKEDYQELFDAIGVAWGTASDPALKFKVPDLRDRALYGIGSTVSLGATDGKGSGNRGGPWHHHDVSGNTQARGAHGHSLSLNGVGDHTHSVYAPAGSLLIQQGTQGGYASVANYEINQPQSGGGGAHNHSGSVGNVGDHTHPFSASTGGGYDDKPSFAGIRYAITTGKSSIAA